MDIQTVKKRFGYFALCFFLLNLISCADEATPDKDVLVKAIEQGIKEMDKEASKPPRLAHGLPMEEIFWSSKVVRIVPAANGELLEPDRYRCKVTIHMERPGFFVQNPLETIPFEGDFSFTKLDGEWKVTEDFQQKFRTAMLNSILPDNFEFSDPKEMGPVQK